MPPGPGTERRAAGICRETPMNVSLSGAADRESENSPVSCCAGNLPRRTRVRAVNRIPVRIVSCAAFLREPSSLIAAGARQPPPASPDAGVPSGKFVSSRRSLFTGDPGVPPADSVLHRWKTSSCGREVAAGGDSTFKPAGFGDPALQFEPWSARAPPIWASPLASGDRARACADPQLICGHSPCCARWHAPRGDGGRSPATSSGP